MSSPEGQASIPEPAALAADPSAPVSVIIQRGQLRLAVLVKGQAVDGIGALVGEHMQQLTPVSGFIENPHRDDGWFAGDQVRDGGAGNELVHHACPSA